MIEPIYASEEHKQIIETYITMCTEFAKDVSSKTRYNNYLDVLDVILRIPQQLRQRSTRK